MNLRRYYQQLSQLESQLDEYVLVRSKANPIGGKEGRITEVGRQVAARMLMQDAVDVLSPAEAKQFRQDRQEAYAAITEAREQRKLQVALLSNADITIAPEVASSLTRRRKPSQA